MPQKQSDGIRKKQASSGYLEKFARTQAEPTRSAQIPEPVRAQSDAKIPHETLSEPSPAPASLSRTPQEPRQRWRIRRMRLALRPSFPAPSARAGVIAGAIAGAILIVLLSTVWARLTVSIKPRVEEIALDDIAAMLDASSSGEARDAKSIPAEQLSFVRTVRKEFPATGKERVEERARGKIKIFNRFNSSPQPLVAGTRLLSEGGALFRLAKAVAVPGATIEQGSIRPQFIEAEAAADVPGEGSNLSGSVRLSIPGFSGTPKYDGFYAVAEQGFSGGFRGDAIVASLDDLKKAQEAATKQVFDEIKADIGAGTPPGLTGIEALREIQIVRVEAPPAGTRGNTFAVSAEARGTALAFRQSDAANFARSLTIADDKTHEFVDGSARLEYRVRSADFKTGRADIVIRGSFRVRSVIAPGELAVLISGKKQGSATDLLRARPEIASASLSFFPPWRSQAPGDPSKIRIRLERRRE